MFMYSAPYSSMVLDIWEYVMLDGLVYIVLDDPDIYSIRFQTFRLITDFKQSTEGPL